VARDNFIFYRSFFEGVDNMPQKNQLVLYKAIMEFALNEEEPKLNGIEKAIFSLIRPQLEANNKRYEDGKKGGRPKEKETKKKPVVIEKDSKLDNQWLLTEETITEPNKNVNVNDNVNDNVNVNVNDIVSKKERNINIITKESARESYDDIFDKMEVSEPLKRVYIEFIKHCQLNGKTLINSKLTNIIIELDMRYKSNDDAKINSLRNAINSGYFDIKENKWH